MATKPIPPESGGTTGKADETVDLKINMPQLSTVSVNLSGLPTTVTSAVAAAEGVGARIGNTLPFTGCKDDGVDTVDADADAKAKACCRL